MAGNAIYLPNVAWLPFHKAGNASPDNRKQQELPRCISRGHSSNADYVAAQNILAAWHAVPACGETAQQGRSVKQEPASAVA